MSETYEKFIERVRAKSDEVGECWEWRGAMSSNGSPTIKHHSNSNSTSLRRVMLTLQGKAMGDLRAVATCGNPLCVNPDHIAAWTRSRVLKRAEKDTGYTRRATRNAAISATLRRKSPLTPQLVTEIRLSSESAPVIAQRLGVCASSIRAIRRYEAWKDYQNPYLQLAA